MDDLVLPDFSSIPDLPPKPMSTDDYLKFIEFCFKYFPPARETQSSLEARIYLPFILVPDPPVSE